MHLPDFQTFLSLLDLPPSLFYLVICILMFLNSSVQIPPSEYVCLATGIILGSSEVHFLVIAIILATAFNFLGTTLWYALGMRHGQTNKSIRIEGGVSRSKLVNWIYNLYTEKLNHIEYLFKQHGFIMVFVLRNVPVIRSICSYPAGKIRLKFLPFSICSIAGILLWVSIWTITGKILGYIAIEYHWQISVLVGCLSLMILKLSFAVLNNKILKT